MMTKLIYGSLFSGIGGFDLGFDQAGLTCAWQVEKDKAAQSVLERHWPNVPKYEDVQNVGKRNLEPVDLICGGFPCQDISVAGRRAGLAGERSGLWFEFRRIIAELRPQWVVIENVPGLLSSNGGRDMGAIVGALGEFGYWWAYRCLDAQYWGVPQRRRRVFIVGCLAKGCAQEVLFERQSSPWDTPPSREEGAELAKDVAATIKGGSGQRGYPIEWEAGLTVCAITERTRSAGRTLEIQEDLAYALTNPGSGGRSHSRLICFAPNTRDEVRLMNGDGQIAGALSARPGMKQQSYIAWDGRNFNGTGQITSTLQSKKNGYSLNYQPLIGVRRLTPLEAERLQGFPDNHTAGQSDSARYRQLGNAVAVPVARWLGRRIVDLI